MTVVGLVFACAVLYGLVFERRALQWILGASVCFTATGALYVGDQTVTPFYLVGGILLAQAIIRRGFGPALSANLSFKPGALPLLGFALWSAAVTIVVPRALSGAVEVLNPRLGIDRSVFAPTALSPTISNLAQLIYIVFGIGLIYWGGSRFRLSPWVAAVGMGLGTVLSSIRYALPTTLQTEVFDNSRNVTYTVGTLNGVERVRGIFSEPSAFGAFSVASLVFFLVASGLVTSYRRLVCIALAIWSLVHVVLSGSGTAVVTGVVIALLLAAKQASGFLLSQQRVSSVKLAAVFLALPFAVLYFPVVYSAIVGVADDKVVSSSYANRTAADDFSYGVLWDTYGLGAGLGSNRPSSFLAAALSAVGIVGTLLLAYAIFSMLRRSFAIRELRPAAWALVALLVSKVVAGPDLSDPVMWLLLASLAGVLWQPSANASYNASGAA